MTLIVRDPDPVKRWEAFRMANKVHGLSVREQEEREQELLFVLNITKLADGTYIVNGE